jgi:membrane peptidoglycan carboxypeptidase
VARLFEGDAGVGEREEEQRDNADWQGRQIEDGVGRQFLIGASRSAHAPSSHAWTIGCVPQLCVGVWVGNTDGAPMVRASSSLTAGKVWADVITAPFEHYQLEPQEFPFPGGIVFEP